jgi:hypothetical protein
MRFSRSGESADDVITRMAHKEREKALVVSSDREVTDSAAANGAATISSQEFETKIEMAAHFDSPIGEAEDSRGWTPTTRKKGPSRRLPKKQRRNRMKIKKL